MALRIELKPFEELFISRSVIQNGPEKVAFAISGGSPLLRGRDHLPGNAVDSPCKELQFAVQTLYLEELDYDLAITGIRDVAHELCAALPGLSRQVAEILEQLEAGDTFKALKSCRGLVELEGRA